MIGAVRNARIAGADAPVDLFVDDGRITQIRPASGHPATGCRHQGTDLDAEGRAVVPGLVDAHVHLDKAYQLDALAAAGLTVGSLPDAVAATRAVKVTQGDGERMAAAERLLGRMVRYGTAAARVHVELDGSGDGLEALAWHVELARVWADRIALQLVAFPQHGLFREPGAAAVLALAMDHGCTVVGGCPYADDDPQRHIGHVFDVAAERTSAVDFHVDFTDDETVHDVDLIIDESSRRGWGKRVTVGHVTSLAAMDTAAMERRAAALHKSETGVISLPATDLFLSGRGADRNRPRGVAPLARLMGAGLTVAVATNNVCNAFTPYGNGSLLQIAWLAGLVGQFEPGTGHRLLLTAVTTAPARLLELDHYGLDVACWADLVVLDTDRPEMAVAGPAEVVAVVHHGHVVWPGDHDPN